MRTPNLLEKIRSVSMSELRIALVLIAFSLIGATAMTPDPARARPASYSSEGALNLAHELQELASSLPYRDGRLAPTAGFVAPDATLTAASPLDGRGRPAAEGYVRTWRIVEHKPATNMKTIEVRVEWPRRVSGTQELTLATIVAR